MARDQISTAAYMHQYLEPAIQRDNDERAQSRRRLDELVNAHDRLRRDHNDLQAKHNNLQAAFHAQGEQLDEVKAALAGAMKLMTSIDRRFTEMAAVYTKDRHPNLQTENDNRHHDVAGEYERFLQGEVFPLVITPTVSGRILPADGQAHALSAVNRVLFGSVDPSPQAVQAALALYGLDYPAGELTDVCGHAVEIRAKTAKLGPNQRWDFELGEGLFDQARQERVAGSGDSEVVACVVAPGYLRDDGQLLVRQRVLTGPQALRQAGRVLLPEHTRPPLTDYRTQDIL
jgi:hypothetical protein